jgi:hypothetical protein
MQHGTDAARGKPDMTMKDDYDLAMVLAAGLRAAHEAGDADRKRRIAATLRRVVHLLSHEAGVSGPGADMVHFNGRVDPGRVAALLGPYAPPSAPGSLNALIVRAERAGRHAADLAHGAGGQPATGGGEARHPGDGAGRLVLEAYRSFGVGEMRAVVRHYQAGYNARAGELGDLVVRWVEIRNGMRRALPGATGDEARDIVAAL